MSDSLPEEIDVESAAPLLPPGTTRWIDCREIDEWHICHIAGAELLPLSNLVEEAKRKLAEIIAGVRPVKTDSLTASQVCDKFLAFSQVEHKSDTYKWHLFYRTCPVK